MKQSYLYVVKTDQGYIDSEFNFSKDIFSAAQFIDENQALGVIGQAGDILVNPKVNKVLCSVMLTPVL